jgi:SAM-dependent methyltransferase
VATTPSEAIGGFCGLCGAPTQVRLRDACDPVTLQRFDVSFCRHCGIGITMPQPAELGSYYGERYYGRRHWITTSYCVWRRMRVVKLSFGGAHPRSLLDVGCGDGSFLEAACRKRWSVAGTEINVAVPASAGFHIWPSLRGVDAQFDCITCWHVLEHLRDPLASLREMHCLLTPGGVLLVAVPDAGGLQFRTFRRFWFHLDVPRHLFHFDLPCIRLLLEKTGFQLVSVWHHELEYDLFGWIQSTLNVLLKVPNVLFDFLTGKARRTGYPLILLSLLFAAAAFPAAFALTVLSTLKREGGTLIVAARRSE